MKRWFLSMLAIFFPWIVLLIYDNPGGAFVALVMQATLFGWPPASMWALRVVGEHHHNTKKTPKNKKTEHKKKESSSSSLDKE